MNTGKQLFDEINNNLKPNKLKPELGEFTTLVLHDKGNKVEFCRGWNDEFIVSFNPKTVGVKYSKIDSESKKRVTISKQYPLDQKDLLMTILNLLN